MTSPNFLSHIGPTGFIPQPGIGDVLGAQFQNLAKAKSLQIEQRQRQQQQDQLGQYYQGQVNEMSRLRDQQEAAARATAQNNARIQQERAALDRDLPITPEMDEKTRHETLVKRTLRMAQYEDPMTGEMTNLVNVMRPKDENKPVTVGRDQRLVDPATGKELTPAMDKDPVDRAPQHVSPGGWLIGPDGKVIFHAPDRPTAAGGGSPIQLNRFEQKLEGDYELKVKPYLERFQQMEQAITDAPFAANGDGSAQVSLLYSFIRSVDPNRVTDSERAMVQKAQSLANIIETKAKGFAEAQVVATKMVPQIVATIKRHRQSMGKQVNFHRTQAIRQAKDRYGDHVKTPETLFIDYSSLYGDEGGGLSPEERKAAAAFDSLARPNR